jgi:O-Antigen ligase
VDVARPASSAGVAVPLPRGARPVASRATSRRLFFAALILAAAMPVEIAEGVPIVNSLSILDVLLLVGALTLFLDLAYRPLDLGYRHLFWILCIPLAASLVSVVWSQDRSATVRTAFITAEGVVAYLLAVRELDGLSPARIVTFIRRYAYLLIIPGVLLLLHVPGFEPQVTGIKESSGEYISYFTRFSHPVLGRSNNLATVLAFLAPILLYWGHTYRDRRATIAGFVTVFAIFATLSRGTLVAFALAGLVYAAVSPKNRDERGSGFGGKIASAMIVGALAVVLLYTFNPATREFFHDRLTLANVSGRSELLSVGVEKFGERPLLGYGAGVAPDPTLGEGVHNTYLQQVLSFGLTLGVVVGLALCATAIFFLARQRSSPLAGVIGYAVLVQLAIFLFEASFEGSVLRVLFYLSMGLSVALLRAVERETALPARE